ncbi:MAG: tRNA pseudouridine(55) synthase TruB [Gammaproteobacteria bacterium]|nr:tRNA pseudouridine(55) synthase TruB [Gammaproteobacteria bacterium]
MARRSRKPKGFRDINGILLLNKPLGLSSNKALQAARNIFKANKAGHTGSLDPLATGLLPICFGEATKYSSFLLDSSKSYRATCKLGITTTTGDAEGDILEQKTVDVNRAQIESVIAQFTGKIQQIPPMHSAVKHQGERLYVLARKGLEVERQSREITIYNLELLSFEDDRVDLAIHCSKGTYIRTLVEDIGKTLGCGAYLTSLHRTGVQPFWDETSYTLDDLREISQQGLEALDQCLLPIEHILMDWPKIELDSDLTYYLLQGQPVQIPQSPTSGYVRLIDGEKGFIGLGFIQSDGRIAPKRMMRV